MHTYLTHMGRIVTQTLFRIRDKSLAGDKLKAINAVFSRTIGPASIDYAPDSNLPDLN